MLRAARAQEAFLMLHFACQLRLQNISQKLRKFYFFLCKFGLFYILILLLVYKRNGVRVMKSKKNLILKEAYHKETQIVMELLWISLRKKLR